MKPVLTEADNLFDFFNARITDARTEVERSISDDTALYLATLLADRARSDRTGVPETTLAELHGRASSAPPGKQASAYRELGDRALYFLGFFRESLERERRAIGPAYYEDMGAAAYYKVDLVLKRWFSDAFGPVFTELAEGFRDCVDLVDRVRSKTNEEGLMHSYERWLVTSTPGDAASLYAGGLILPREPTSES